MTYFNLWNIGSAFWMFLFDKDRKLDSVAAISLLLIVPLLVSATAMCRGLVIGDELYGSLVSIFSIFGAFLFASQISVFTIFRILVAQTAQDASSSAHDPITRSLTQAYAGDKLVMLKDAFKGINASLSYLVLVSICILTILFVVIILRLESALVSTFIIYLSLHFLLVLLVVTRICHEVFDAGYAT